jgi:hypothetical protein
MEKKFTISILVFFISAVPIVLGLRAVKPHQMPLRDGFALRRGVDGKLALHDGNDANSQLSADRWFFELDSDLSDGRGLVKAGTRLELLPSSILERIIADANNRAVTSYRLRGRVTRYRGKNFIFPTYFLPLTKTKKAPPPTPHKTPPQETRPTINEPNDVLTIPKELIDKLPDRTKGIDHRERQERSKAITTQLTEGSHAGKTGLKQNFTLVDRTAIFGDTSRGAERTWRNTSFVLDALGRKEAKISLRLLPCQVLERAQREQSTDPEVVRFKIAGIVTKYKGKNYLLLQRATRVYSHGNFPG